MEPKQQRNRELAIAVLRGESLTQLARRLEISRERARQIFMATLRRADSERTERLAAQCALTHGRFVDAARAEAQAFLAALDTDE